MHVIGDKGLGERERRGREKEKGGGGRRVAETTARDKVWRRGRSDKRG